MTESSGALLTTENNKPLYLPVDTLVAAPVPPVKVPSGQELRRNWWTTTGTGSSDLRIVQVAVLRTPSQGLELEVLRTVVQTFRPGSTTPDTDHTIPGFEVHEHELESIAGNAAGKIAVSWNVGDKGDGCQRTCVTTVLDPTSTRAITPPVQGEQLAFDTDRLVIKHQEQLGRYCVNVTARAVDTLAEQWRYDPRTELDTDNCSARALNQARDNRTTWPFVVIETRTGWHPLSVVTGRPTRPAFTGAHRVALDPMADLLLVHSGISNDSPALEVFDTTTWTSVFTLSTADAGALGAETNPATLIGGHLYVITKDGRTVTDVRARKTLSQDYRNKPTEALNGRWVLVEAGGYKDLYPLVNGRYEGPWF
ncbi:hypothetical protein [Nocardia lasii]|uniref:Uncharacterized protein n=1 Tax=Nocardia lasii TaxID=1616107 RepID=A0ABW1JN04_9NOCA